MVHETKIGVSAASDAFRSASRRLDPADDGCDTDEEQHDYLAFGRVNGGYCIHVLHVTLHAAPMGEDRIIDSTRTVWASCDRETRLKAFERVPELLDRIIASAKEQAESAKKTAAQIQELLGGEKMDAKSEPASSAALIGQIKIPLKAAFNSLPNAKFGQAVAMARSLKLL